MRDSVQNPAEKKHVASSSSSAGAPAPAFAAAIPVSSQGSISDEANNIPKTNILGRNSAQTLPSAPPGPHPPSSSSSSASVYRPAAPKKSAYDKMQIRKPNMKPVDDEVPVDLVERILPRGTDMWTRLATEFNRTQSVRREGKALKKRYDDLLRLSKGGVNKPNGRRTRDPILQRYWKSRMNSFIRSMGKKWAGRTRMTIRRLLGITSRWMMNSWSGMKIKRRILW